MGTRSQFPEGKRPHEMTPDELKSLPEATIEVERKRFLLLDVLSDKAIHSWQDEMGRWQPVTDGERWYKRRLWY